MHSIIYMISPSVFVPLSRHVSLVAAAGHGLENTRGDKVRIFRAEKSYAVTQGKWYFEFEAVTTGEMRVGWARPSVRSDTELGADELAYVFNGNKVSPHVQFRFVKSASTAV